MSSLKHALAKDPDRCLFLENRESFLEFHPDASRCYGFSLSQLIHYTIEPLDAANDGPPQKITLGFSTADVIVSGWRLDNFAEELRSHKGGIVKTLPAPDRYKNLSPHTSAVADITIKPIGKQGS